MNDNEKVEQLAIDLKCDAPRVTLESIQNRIKEVEYNTFEMLGRKFMFCAIKMDNGYIIVGEPSICIDPTNWREDIVREISYKNSFNKIWALVCYRLASELMPS